LVNDLVRYTSLTPVAAIVQISAGLTKRSEFVKSSSHSGKGCTSTLGFQHDVESNPSHVEPGINEVAPRSVQHESKIQITGRPVFAANTSAEHDNLYHIVAATQSGYKRRRRALRNRLIP
jgi:hypothetical protein